MAAREPTRGFARKLTGGFARKLTGGSARRADWQDCTESERGLSLRRGQVFLIYPGRWCGQKVSGQPVVPEGLVLPGVLPSVVHRLLPGIFLELRGKHQFPDFE